MSSRRAGDALRISAIEPRSVVNGPGERFVIWVQGCNRRCPDCINHDFLPLDGGSIVRVGDLAAAIRVVAGIEGITLTGGEPMLQAPALVSLLEMISDVDLGVVCYTGYTLAELRSAGNAATAKLLAACDILIDGPYLADHAAELKWRGSSNQELHFLTGRYSTYAQSQHLEERDIEFVLSGSQYSVNGSLQLELIRKLEEELRGPTMRKSDSGCNHIN